MAYSTKQFPRFSVYSKNYRVCSFVLLSATRKTASRVYSLLDLFAINSIAFIAIALLQVSRKVEYTRMEMECTKDAMLYPSGRPNHARYGFFRSLTSKVVRIVPPVIIINS